MLPNTVYPVIFLYYSILLFSIKNVVDLLAKWFYLTSIFFLTFFVLLKNHSCLYANKVLLLIFWRKQLFLDKIENGKLLIVLFGKTFGKRRKTKFYIELQFTAKETVFLRTILNKDAMNTFIRRSFYQRTNRQNNSFLWECHSLGWLKMEHLPYSIRPGWCNNWVASTRIAGQIEM